LLQTTICSLYQLRYSNVTASTFVFVVIKSSANCLNNEKELNCAATCTWFYWVSTRAQ